ncbi:MAG TPA: hypothetical protein VIE65_13045 [Methylobacter sp.]|jgi:hypothetical protein
MLTQQPKVIRTEQEILRLKLDWQRDPIWDIEDTDGFEAHREELLKYRLECAAQWEAKHTAKLKSKAESLGVPGNLKLAGYVLNLEAKLEELQNKLYQ